MNDRREPFEYMVTFEVSDINGANPHEYVIETVAWTAGDALVQAKIELVIPLPALTRVKSVRPKIPLSVIRHSETCSSHSGFMCDCSRGDT